MIKWFEKNYWLAWIFVIFFTAVIFYISSLTFNSKTTGSPTKSILYHLIVFFLLAFFLLIALVRGRRYEYIIIGILLAITYGVIDEIHQSFVPGRFSSLTDVFVNTVGISFALLIYAISLVYRNNNKPL